MLMLMMLLMMMMLQCDFNAASMQDGRKTEKLNQTLINRISLVASHVIGSTELDLTCRLEIGWLESEQLRSDRLNRIERVRISWAK